ncbi:MAG: heme lyase CcmF/NrfE family subunit, partial [Acidimicrobiia bacterium]
MLAFLGSAGVIAALIGSILLAVRGIRGARGGPSDLRAPGKLVLAGAVISMVAMQIALLTDDFSLAYVANHHSSATPFPFDVATAWAALEGSIILWGLVLAVFTWVVVRQASDRLGSAAVAVMAGVGIFFFGLMITVANPFEVCVDALATGCAASTAWPFAAADVPVNGPGPNPLLQNHFLMAVHPPVLY